MTTPVRRLTIANVDAALRAYYGNGYIGNREICEIFGVQACTACTLKKTVANEESKRGMAVIVQYHVNVKIAFEVWGIDVAELERNRKKLRELGLANKE